MRFIAGICRTIARLGDTRGATAVEYGLILALICLAMMGSLIALGNASTTMWGNISSKVQSVS